MSKWIQHVKDYSEQNNMKYNEALSDPVCRALYYEMKGGALTADETRKLLKSSYNKKNKDVGNFKVDKHLSGNRTKVYYDEENNMPVVVHRGTNSKQDMMTDTGLLFGHRGNRFKHAKKIQKKAEKKYGTENMHTLGHSLGGLVAEEIGKNSKNVITYNKAISPFEMLKKNQSNQTDIKTSNDPVSSLNYFNNNKKNKTKVFNAKTNNPFKSHSTDALKHLNTDKVIGE